ncbi:MAG: class I SAM-dependent methyltransferase [Candidatus Nitrosocosmicus sp.]
MKRIDLGCGNSKKEGFIGVDSLPLSNVDIIHNLTDFPYPFEDNEIDEIWMDNVLEHIPQPVKVMEEIYRICKNGARLNIAVPYFRSFYAFIDPTHVNFFGVWWFNYFDPRHRFYHKYQYSKAQFKIERIEFDREFKNGKINFFRRKLISYANKHPEKYEARFSHLFPLNSLTFYLTVLK